MRTILLILLSLAARSQSTTIRPGNWTNPKTWDRVPKNNTPVIINHAVTLDTNVTVHSLLINGKLTFKPTRTTTLTTTDNIIVYGTLSARPTANYTHTIKIDSVGPMIGGGMDILKQDKGIWVRGAGKLDLQGTAKTAWVHGTVAGNKVTAKQTGWRVGDLLVITPTGPITDKDFYLQFDTVRVLSIAGTTITTTPTKYLHRGKPEILNLTRNVRITGGGHINIAMAGKQTIAYTSIDGLGAYNTIGRYPLHFHHCTDGTNGSTVTGVVITNSKNHAFVPHASHGITFKNCIAYNTIDAAYWYDDSDGTTFNHSNNTTWDSCVSALVTPAESPYSLPSFQLGSGIGNRVTNCVAVGNTGAASSAGYFWPATSNYTDNVWVYTNNTSHNNRTDGNRVWQNDRAVHNITGIIAYNNGWAGLESGAYVNNYRYQTATLSGNRYGVYLHALPNDSMSFTGIVGDTLYITAHTLPGERPVLFYGCKFTAVVIDDKRTGVAGAYDLVNCSPVIIIRSMSTGSVVRVQDNGLAYKVTVEGKETIEAFYKYFKIN